jgi:hypothetical protein
MSDTDEKEVKPMSEDLRRSKRNKFRLDVVAVLSRRSPDYRRIGSKFESLNKTSFKPKDANNVRHAFNLAPILEPAFPILTEEKDISEISSSTPVGSSLYYVIVVFSLISTLQLRDRVRKMKQKLCQ